MEARALSEKEIYEFLGGFTSYFRRYGKPEQSPEIELGYWEKFEKLIRHFSADASFHLFVELNKHRIKLLQIEDEAVAQSQSGWLEAQAAAEQLRDMIYQFMQEEYRPLVAEKAILSADLKTFYPWFFCCYTALTTHMVDKPPLRMELLADHSNLEVAVRRLDMTSREVSPHFSMESSNDSNASHSELEPPLVFGGNSVELALADSINSPLVAESRLIPSEEVHSPIIPIVRKEEVKPVLRSDAADLAKRISKPSKPGGFFGKSLLSALNNATDIRQIKRKFGL